MEGQFDAAWSISVVEHITGTYDDRDTMRWLFRSLRPGGRLIVTVPVDRQAWDEYRDQVYYGQAGESSSIERHFFQRFYDSASIQERLIAPIGQAPARIEWYGERVAGHFHTYIKRWQQEGFAVIANDASEFARSYKLYDRWDDMPGFGVCGLLFVR
jgi:cyclopropane fatty-acyl-phospholipid synthase-like methyltransferase